jgi:hypothetical protein
MNARTPILLAGGVVGATTLAAVWSAARPAAGAPAAEAVRGPAVTETITLPPELVAEWRGQPASAPRDVADVTRLVSENFEQSPFPPRGSKWTIADSCTTLPGQNDVLSWGRQTAEFTVGGAGLWSVGGGSQGVALSAANKDYPTAREGGGPCPGIRTTLVYSPLDFSGVSDGMRVTFDYLSNMPTEALFIGAGDLDKPNPDGGYSLNGFRNFDADSGGEWRRGVHVELGEWTSRVKRVIFGIIYADPPPTGAGPISTGNYGVFIDNVHLDAKFRANAPYIPSPSPTDLPTFTPTRTPRPVTSTPTRPVVNTDTPTPTRATPTPGNAYNYMPLSMKHFDRPDVRPPPTALTATNTPTITATPTRPTSTPTFTRSPEPTETLLPTETDVPIPTPTTPVPEPDVRIVEILYVYFRSPRKELEWVTLKNLGTGPQNMTGWRLFEQARGNTCTIPAGTVIQPDAEYQIRSGGDAEAGVVDGIDGFVCKGSLMWDNSRDQAQLFNPSELYDCRGYNPEVGFYGCK